MVPLFCVLFRTGCSVSLTMAIVWVSLGVTSISYSHRMEQSRLTPAQRVHHTASGVTPNKTKRNRKSPQTASSSV